MSKQQLEKICQNCYLPFSWRKKWEKNWEDIKFCSERCRRNYRPKQAKVIEVEILKLINERAPSSICPSEVARTLYTDWKPKMEKVRQVARKLHLADQLEIQQKGKKVPNLLVKGPIRLKSSR